MRASHRRGSSRCERVGKGDLRMGRGIEGWEGGLGEDGKRDGVEGEGKVDGWGRWTGGVGEKEWLMHSELNH